MKIQEAIEELKNLTAKQLVKSAIRRESKDYYLFLTIIMSEDAELMFSLQCQDRHTNDQYGNVPLNLDDIMADDWYLQKGIE